MPTKKIGEIGGVKPCLDPCHYPPKYQVFDSGIYEHTCPACGHITIFQVCKPIYADRYPKRISNIKWEDYAHHIWKDYAHH